MKILFLSAWFPYPPNNGSKLRIYNLLRGLAREHEVTLISFSDCEGQTLPRALNRLCRKVIVIPVRAYRASSMRALLGLFHTKPRVLVDRYMPEVEACLQAELSGGEYDLAIASQWYTADYLQNLPGIPAIFDEVEIGVFKDNVDRANNPVLRMRHELTNLKLRMYYQRLLKRFDACTVVSKGEQRLLAQMAPDYGPVKIVPNGVSLEDYLGVEKDPQRDTLIFTGSFTYRPNYEAMRWFLKEVYPQVRRRIPQVHLLITGNHDELPLPDETGVTRTGFVPDVRPMIAGSWASLAPIQSGGGTRLKILEAMAMGTPVIATSKGIEGIDARHEQHLLIADTPEEYAAATVRLLKDARLRRRLSENAFELVCQRYSWKVIMPRFLKLVQKVARPSSKAAVDTKRVVEVKETIR